MVLMDASGAGLFPRYNARRPHRAGDGAGLSSGKRPRHHGAHGPVRLHPHVHGERCAGRGVHVPRRRGPEPYLVSRREARAIDVASRQPLDSYRGELAGPRTIASDKDIEEWFRRTAITAHHPCGTCAIGSVVDPQLRVLGAQGLRVVDASAMPDIVSAHINACVLMMAEKASDMILGHAPPPPALNA